MIIALFSALDPEKEKISFGIKQLTPDPFHEFFKDKNKGDIVSATITKINNNGIDVEVANFIETTIRRKELSKNKEEQNISRYFNHKPVYLYDVFLSMYIYIQCVCEEVNISQN